jgi:hypothetical protein
LNFLMQVKTETELLAASHCGYVGLRWWDLRGAQFLRDGFPGGIPRQKHGRQVVDEQKKGEDRNRAEWS